MGKMRGFVMDCSFFQDTVAGSFEFMNSMIPFHLNNARLKVETDTEKCAFWLNCHFRLHLSYLTCPTKPITLHQQQNYYLKDAA